VQVYRGQCCVDVQVYRGQCCVDVQVYRGQSCVYVQVYRGQSVGIDDMAADTVSTGSRDDTASAITDCCDVDKASMNGAMDLASPLQYRPTGDSLTDAELDDETHWVLLACHFGVPLFDADVNRSVCRRIAKHGLCNHARSRATVALPC